MSLKIRRGTNAERLTITPVEGELIYTTDTKNLYIGDGIIAGGKFITGPGYTGSIGIGYSGSAGAGYTGSAGVGYTGSASAGYTGSKGNDGSFGGAITSNINIQTYNINNDGGVLVVNGDTGDISCRNLSSSTVSWGNTTTDTYGAIYKGTFPQQIKSSNIRVLDAVGSISGPQSFGPSIYSSVSRGTYLEPTPTQPGDTLGGFLMAGYYNNRYDPYAGISTRLDNSAIIGELGPYQPKGNAILRFFVMTNSGIPKEATLDYAGTFTSPVLASSGYSGSNYPTPTKGMIIYDTTLDHFYGYNGAWVRLDN